MPEAPIHSSLGNLVGGARLEDPFTIVISCQAHFVEYVLHDTHSLLNDEAITSIIILKCQHVSML